jgi:hypothetical protein
LNINFPMPKPKEIVLQTNLAVEDCIHRIQESTDSGERTLFSLSGYKGSKPLLVKFDGNQFKLWKRRYYRNDFSPYFYGTLSAENQGTRIQGHFDINRWTKIFMRIWLAGVVLFTLPVLLATLRQTAHGDAWVGVAVPIGLIAFGILMPNFGRWLGRNEEKYIKDFLETTLLAQPTENEIIVSQRIIDNRPM